MPASGIDPAHRGGHVVIATLGLWGFLAYLAIVLLLDETWLGIAFSDFKVAGLLLLLLGVLLLGLRALARAGLLSRPAGFGIGVLGLVTTGSFLGVDLAYAIYLNAQDAQSTTPEYRRLRDAQVWFGEILPRWYEPEGPRRRLHKPGVELSGTTFGEFYDASMLASPTLRDRVLEERRVSFAIDAQGYRETTPLSEARIFALGDSMVFGYSIAQEAVWTEVLESSGAGPVYNMGFPAVGPRPELHNLRALLRSQEDRVQIDHLLWMIFEGNDLENSYSDASHLAPGGGSLFRGTVIEAIRAVPLAMKRQSVLQRMRAGSLEMRRNLSTDSNPRNVDGVEIDFLFYDSPERGPRLFNPEHVQRAQDPESYVRQHPNWPRLLETLDEMRELADERGFPVTIVLAPTATRIHGAAYKDFPEISERPWFLEAVAAEARERGYPVLDLTADLRASADRGLLYFRDDHHWNVRGNEVVADSVARYLGQADGGSPR